jgi:TolB-like protein/Tfp pilus assembly protein PilF
MSESGGNGIISELRRRNVFRVAIAYVVVTWLLLQVVDILVPLLTLPEWVGRLILLLLLVGFPIALLFAWAFELTPEGVKLEKNVDRSASITHVTGRKLDRTIIGVLVVALAAAIYANFQDDPEPVPATASTEQVSSDEVPEVTATSEKPSIAVLPFANRSANQSDEFFVDGMHDDLLTQLAKISGLKVISRTSVLQYRDTEKSMKIIGAELGAKALLEGGVQRAGDRIRINVQLIDASTDEHLWAETYNRELTADNIFEIQEEISLEIAGALHAALSPDEKKRISGRATDSMAAYEAYLFGRQRLATRNADAVEEAIDYFKIAVEQDENFADAIGSMAEAYLIQVNGGTLSLEDMLVEVRPLAAKLKVLNQESGITYNALGGLAEYQGDIELAEAYYRKAIEVSPGYTTAYVWLALLLSNFTGDFEGAARLYQTAADLDPMATLPRYNLATQLSALGLNDEAMAEIRKGIEIDPTVATTYGFGGWLLSRGFGRIAEGLAWSQQGAALDQASIGVVPALYLALGDFASARIWRDTYTDVNPGTSWGGEQQIALLQYEGKTQEAAEVAIGYLDQPRDTAYFPDVLRAIRDHFLDVEREGDAIEAYRSIYPELLLETPNVNRSNFQAAVDLVLLLQAAGETADASVLAERTFPVLDGAPVFATFGKFLLEVELHAILGDRDKAIDVLSTIVDSGWTAYVSPNNRNLSSIANDPAYLRLMDVIRQRTDAERAKVRDMEEKGLLARTPDDLVNVQFELEL